ncbi:Methionine synthase I, cobalamin-binding protein domain protein [Salipiger mucosus DSM 16094]|uniref:Methionine synthase I, cobalamin-binding protein domain protein n=2 Tax=Salipiger mucosus TaxID=263378 RepID=S9QAS5_9RHOB|nr:Methionine synthase I, cobalamin-binding protein domain protein [Salipiger mucosus DSM 16094]
MERLFGMIFGSGGNVVKETAEVFRVNAEAQATRDAGLREAALEQFAAEFAAPRRSRFDRLMDALNRLPRPAMALGTLGLFVAAMVDPAWFAARMTGIALVPEPLWWLLGAVVSFYFGARHQAKGQEFQRQLTAAMADAPRVMGQLREIEALRAAPEAAHPPDDTLVQENAALADWRATRG